MLYRIPLRLLGDLASPRALERTIEESAKAKGTSLERLSRQQLEDILRRDVYRRLQFSVPAPMAKRRIQEVLEALKESREDGPDNRLALLEDASKRFSLYFDWPETQRLRALLNVLRDAGSDQQDALLAEGEALVTQLDQRLSEGLVAQGSEIAELSAIAERLEAGGGPKVRRLGSLLKQLKDAQAQNNLLPGELERARGLAHSMRRKLESSVMGLPEESLNNTASLPPEAAARLNELDIEAEGRDLIQIARDIAPLLRARPSLQEELSGLEARSKSGEVLGSALNDFKARLTGERMAALSEQKEQMRSLDVRMQGLGDVPEKALSGLMTTARLAHDLLGNDSLATDELRSLERTLRTLERGDADAEEQLEAQRELAELERNIEGLGAAGESLGSELGALRQAVERGEPINLSALWASYEAALSRLALEREELDSRAGRVIEEYNTYRQLGGDTVVTLGRLVTGLAGQRDLRTMSAAARADYVRTLEQAEGLLDEARAEHEAAQEIARSFESEDLSGLLGIFDMDTDAASPSEASGKEPEPLRIAAGGAAHSRAVLGNLPEIAGVRWSSEEQKDSVWAQSLGALPSEWGPTLVTWENLQAGEVTLATTIGGAVVVASTDPTHLEQARLALREAVLQSNSDEW